uniref:Uncharacterized protein n=1 Tax=Arundo donax TaxID=35708 RepID=A0A0A8Y4S2_ARUDO
MRMFSRHRQTIHSSHSSTSRCPKRHANLISLHNTRRR